MGEEFTKGNGNIDGNADKQTAGTGTGTGGNSTSTPDTRGNGNGGNGGNGNGSGGSGNGETKEKGLPQLVTVDNTEQTEEEKRQERNRKRRERYQREKAESGQTVKPRKVNKTKASEPSVSSMTKEQMNALLVSTSAVIASRPNCSHWLITEKEADTITTPLLKMIAESEKLEFVTKNSNQIALVIACITIFAPRIFITMQQNKALPKKEKKPNVKPEQIRPPENSNQSTNRNDDARPTATDSYNGDVLSWDDF
jgi:hypothetical protein